MWTSQHQLLNHPLLAKIFDADQFSLGRQLALRVSKLE